MDARLTIRGGRRLSPVMFSDLPGLARAVVTCLRHPMSAGLYQTSGLDWVHLRHVQGAFDYYVLNEDWKKILPYLRDGNWNTSLYPPDANGLFSDPNVTYEYAMVDETDKNLYLRVLGTLRVLFPTDYPTSSL